MFLCHSLQYFIYLLFPQYFSYIPKIESLKRKGKDIYLFFPYPLFSCGTTKRSIKILLDHQQFRSCNGRKLIFNEIMVLPNSQPLFRDDPVKISCHINTYLVMINLKKLYASPNNNLGSLRSQYIYIYITSLKPRFFLNTRNKICIVNK